jgi:hypothetical protein
MAGRFAWILAGGVAVLAGMAYQFDAFDDNERETRVEVRSDTPRGLADDRIDGLVERIVEQKLSEARVVDADGEPVAVDSAAMRTLASAVTELVKAETALALLSVDGEPSDAARTAAERRIEAAQARVDAIGEQIETATDRDGRVRDAQRQRIRDEIREEVRTAVRGG